MFDLVNVYAPLGPFNSSRIEIDLQIGPQGCNRCNRAPIIIVHDVADFTRQAPTKDVATALSTVRMHNSLPIHNLFFNARTTLSLGPDADDIANHVVVGGGSGREVFREVLVYSSKDLNMCKGDKSQKGPMLRISAGLVTHISAQIVVDFCDGIIVLL